MLFLDELPPSLEYAVAVPVGNADLSVVTTAALANLFVAVADMDNVCLVLSDLAGTNFSVGQSSLQAALNRAIQGITSESRRIAVPITPVNPNGDELYHILRKRLFESVGPGQEAQRIAETYREALREAHKMGLTTTTPESLYTQCQLLPVPPGPSRAGRKIQRERGLPANQRRHPSHADGGFKPLEFQEGRRHGPNPSVRPRSEPRRNRV